MPASGFVGVVAVSLCVLTLALGWSELRPRSLGVLSVALCLSAALVYVPWQYSRLRSTLPSIHDITTDTDNPPAFINYDDPKLPQLQKAAYPDLAALKAALPVAKAFNEAFHVAKLMPGWTIIAADADTGHIEAIQQSRWFRFTDDIVIRVSGDVAGSRIDMRSTSRQGHSDYGVNASRIRVYLGALRKRIG